MNWSRNGARIFWSFADLYIALALNLYKGKKWLWYLNGWDSWMVALISLGFAQHMERSHTRSGTDTGPDDGIGLLPNNACSSCALLLLLCRFHMSKHTQNGRLNDPQHQAAAECLWLALLKKILSVERPLEIPLMFLAHCIRPWPRPPTNASVLNLPISKLGVVDLRPWKNAQDYVYQQAWKDFELGCTEHLLVSNLTAMFMVSKKWRHLFQCLIRYLGSCLEELALASIM